MKKTGKKIITEQSTKGNSSVVLTMAAVNVPVL